MTSSVLAGVDKKHIAIWDTLIDMRFEEYRNNYKTAIKESKKIKDLKDDTDSISVVPPLNFRKIPHLNFL